MPLSTRVRKCHENVEPIRTSYIDLPDRPRLPVRRKPSPLAKVVQQQELNEADSSDSEDLQEDDSQLIGKALGKLRIPDSDSRDANGLTTPFGTRWTIARQPHPTPVSALSTYSHLITPVIEVQGTGSHHHCQDSNEIRSSVSTEVPKSHTQTGFSTERRQSAPCCGSAIRQLHFQQFREELWKKGARYFGHVEGADVFVTPVKLPRTPGETRTFHVGDTLSPLSPSNRLTVRAVIHSKERVAIGLKRDFDLDILRATIPDPLPSPRSPSFDREALLSILGNNDPEKLEPSSTLALRGRNPADMTKKVESLVRSPSLDRGHRHKFAAVPIHIQYARAQLPALAAILLSDLVRRGDTIDLPVPHPRAWAETVAYVYTGEEELLTEHVKENIVYLGGKI